jgi:Leucine-rich repeat (LRR) protein
MKTKEFLMILLTVLAMTGCNNEIEPESSEVPVIPQEDFPDEEFYNFLLENFDADKDGVISLEEANDVRQIDGSNHYFKSLKGFEYFPNLEKLNLNNVHGIENTLLDLDLSKNTSLTELDATGANIKTLNVTGSPLLKVLRIGNSKIETLDVSKNTSVEILDISYNNIESIDLSKSTVLKELYCARGGETGKKITELDVTANVLLEVLDCSTNSLTMIDITKNSKIKELDISKNDIEFLNLTQNSELRKLNASNTRVSFLDVKNTKIDTLYCCSRPGYLQTVDAKGSRTLKMLECNFIEKLDVSESSIETVVFRDTKHSYSYNPMKMTFLLNNCPNLKEYRYRLDIEGSRGSISEVTGGGSIDLNISNCPSLLTFYSNVLENIKIDNCPKLQELTCKGMFENLDLSNNTGIKTVYCHSQALKTIDLKYCALLTNLYCFGNMQSINLSNNKNLQSLELMDRELTSLNIDALTGLKYLNIAVAPLEETLNITKNVELEELTVRDSAGYNIHTDNMKLYVANLPMLKYIRRASNLLTELKINNCTNLDYVSGLSYLTSYERPCKLEIENCPGLRKVYYPLCSLTDVNIRNCQNLDSLDISNNKLASFQYNGKNLTYLNCSFNGLTSLNISGNTGLKSLDCRDNAINSLTMDECYNIETLDCANNRIPVLRVDSLSELQNLYCDGNLLTSLDISENLVMDKLDCSNNPDLATLYISRRQNFSIFKKDGETEVIYMD